MEAEDRASNKGDVTGLPFGGETTGFISGDWNREEGAGDFVFLKHNYLVKD
jgi:hypothetical protein